MSNSMALELLGQCNTGDEILEILNVIDESQSEAVDFNGEPVSF